MDKPPIRTEAARGACIFSIPMVICSRWWHDRTCQPCLCEMMESRDSQPRKRPIRSDFGQKVTFHGLKSHSHSLRLLVMQKGDFMAKRIQIGRASCRERV